MTINSPDTLRVGTAVSIVLIALSCFVGCNEGQESSDRAQTLVATGNKNLNEMNKLASDLESLGVNVDRETEISSVFRTFDEKNKLEIKSQLETFIRLGEETLSIASKGEVLFAHSEDLSKRIQSAKSWLEVLTRSHK